MKEYLSLAETSKLIGKSKETLRRWDREGILTAVREPVSNYRVYKKEDVQTLLGSLFENVIESHILSRRVSPGVGIPQLLNSSTPQFLNSSIPNTSHT